MKILYAPGPSYNEETGKYAGWVRIWSLIHEALRALGEVYVPDYDVQACGRASAFERCASYSMMALSDARRHYGGGAPDLIVGPPSYASLLFMERWSHGHRPARLGVVFNNADPHRRRMLEPEYERFGHPFPVSPADAMLNKTALLHIDHILACSPFVRGTWGEVFDKERISIAFWGVDSEAFRPAAAPPPGFRILWAGSDFVRKGLIYLLEAVRLAFPWSHEGPPVEVWVVGSKVNLTPEYPFPVRVMGPVPFVEMPALMRECHVSCLPSLEDGVALTIQESMASGLVPIATPDCAEVFEDGVSGIRVPFRDVKAIAEALRALYEDPDRRIRMAREARALAERQTWDTFRREVTLVAGRVAQDGVMADAFTSPMPWLSGAKG